MDIHAPIVIRTITVMLGVLLIGGGCSSTPKYGLDKDDFVFNADRSPTAKTLYRLAQMLAAGGKDVEAEVVLNTCLRRYPFFLPAHVELAGLHVRQRDFDRALEVLQHGLDQAPSDPILHNDIGMCWLLKGDYERALDAFTQAAAGSPDDARFRANLALAAGMLGRYDVAFDIYREIVSRGQAHYNIAVICEARNDHERAQKEYAIAQSMTPARAPIVPGETKIP